MSSLTRSLLALAVLLVATNAQVNCSQVTYESLLVPCDSDDIECLSKSTERFLEQTHNGIPAYKIVPIDPLFIPSFDVVFNSEGLVFKHTNVTVTGLRNQKISYFKMDTKAKSVVLTTKADLTIDGDVTATFTQLSKSLAGQYTSHASVLGTATYNYELKRDDAGIDHFDVGPETISCKVVDTPTIELNPELAQTISNDADIKKFSLETKNEIREKTLCKIVEEAYKSVVHNIRAAAKAFPASAFFKDLS